MVTHTISEKDSGKSIKTFVFETYPLLRRSVFLSALKNGDVKINSNRQRENINLKTGDVLDIFIADKLLNPLSALDIAYEDNNIIIVNKVPGIECYNDTGHSLSDIVSDYMKSRDEYSLEFGFVPLLCHRLDVMTGGLTIFAKSGAAYDCVSESFKQRLIEKYYFTAVIGDIEPKSARLTAYLKKDANRSKVKIYDTPKGKAIPIITSYETVLVKNGISLLNIQLITGRTHQIRAHMAHIGYPILGDDKYGNRNINKELNVNYQVLYAIKIKFNFGQNKLLSYLNGKEIITKNMVLPKAVRDIF